MEPQLKVGLDKPNSNPALRPLGLLTMAGELYAIAGDSDAAGGEELEQGLQWSRWRRKDGSRARTIATRWAEGEGGRRAEEGLEGWDDLSREGDQHDLLAAQKYVDQI